MSFGAPRREAKCSELFGIHRRRCTCTVLVQHEYEYEVSLPPGHFGSQLGWNSHETIAFSGGEVWGNLKGCTITYRLAARNAGAIHTPTPTHASTSGSSGPSSSYHRPASDSADLKYNDTDTGRFPAPGCGTALSHLSAPASVADSHVPTKKIQRMQVEATLL
jgi:hypothetical protein